MSEKKRKKELLEMRAEFEKNKERDHKQFEKLKAIFPNGVLSKGDPTAIGQRKANRAKGIASGDIISGKGAEIILERELEIAYNEVKENKRRLKEIKHSEQRKVAAKISVESKQKTVAKWKVEFQLAYDRANEDLKRKKRSGTAMPEATVNKSKLIKGFILSHPNPKKTKRNPKPKKVYPSNSRSYYTFMEDKTKFP